MGLGQCCLFNTTPLNKYNPFVSPIPFCAGLLVRTNVQCWFSSLCHHNFASSFVLGNHFLPQELHVNHFHCTDMEHHHTCTLSLGFPGNSLSRKCVPRMAPLGSHLWWQHQMLWLWRAADLELTGTTVWAAAQSSTSAASMLPRPTLSTDTCQQVIWFWFMVFMCGLSCIGLTKLFLRGASTTAAESREKKVRNSLERQCNS